MIKHKKGTEFFEYIYDFLVTFFSSKIQLGCAWSIFVKTEIRPIETFLKKKKKKPAINEVVFYFA